MNFTVEKISSSLGKEFIKNHHYSKRCHNGPMCWGLFDGDDLIGVCAFATPSSENVRSSMYGQDRKSEVTELHRLVIVDDTPINTESWFIRKALCGFRENKPNITAALSFADPTEGHRGVIYQASNALYCGRSSAAKFYRDQDGRLRHPRQNGVNITSAMAAERGWTSEKRLGKYRYLFLLGSGRQKRKNQQTMILDVYPYPHAMGNNNDMS